jgi:S-layer homology domain
MTAPFVASSPANAQADAQIVRFFDVPSNHWAKGFIEALATQGIINGFPDGTFRPDEGVTRAQFAAMVQKAFNRQPTRSPVMFTDVPSSYWAYGAIATAYSTSFMSGYPDGGFYPDQEILRSQVLVSLVTGLGYSSNNAISSSAVGQLLQRYSDASEIPSYAQPTIAAATEKSLVVNFPNPRFLNPNRIATRAEVAAFLYQAMVSTGAVTSIASPYVVTQGASPPSPQTRLRIPVGTTLPTRFERSIRIYISPEEAGSVPVTLLIDRDIISPNNTMLIPRNSQVIGELRQVRGGAQFRAAMLVLPNGTQLVLDASSAVVNRTETIYQSTNVNTLLAQAALSPGAAAGITAITGDRTILPQHVLGQAPFNNMIRQFQGRDRVILYAINPNTDLDVTLNAPLALQ